MVNYLTDYPFDPTPDTWALNDTFLKVIEEKEALWKQHGLTWAMGVEREVLLLTPAEFAAYRSDYYTDLSDKELIERNPQWEVSFNVQSRLAHDDTYRDAYVLAEHACDERIEQRIAAAKKPKDIFRAQNEREIFNQIKESWRYSDASRRNLVLAQMHLFSQSEGGLSDLVEYRFGPARHGAGWYDCGSIVEFRTPVIEGMINAISKYNKILWAIKNASEQFGLIPVLTGGPVEPHVHFSFKIDDEKSQSTLTSFGDENAQNFMLQSLQGYMELLEKSPALLHDIMPDEVVDDEHLQILPSRNAVLRICEDNMEVRMDITHLARNMALLIAGCSTYAFDNEPSDDDSSKPTIEMADYPIIPDDFKIRFPAISSSLENCRIAEGGKLIPDADTVGRNLNRMISELGVKPEDIIIDKGKGREQSPNLSQWQGWYSLFLSGKHNGQSIDFLQAHNDIDSLMAQIGNISKTQRPYYLRKAEASHLLSENLSSEEHVSALNKAFGEGAAAEINNHYKKAELNKRQQAALDEVNSILDDAGDIDKPSPDLLEKIYAILQNSLITSMRNTLPGMRGIKDITVVYKLVAQRLASMNVEAEKIKSEGLTSNARASMLIDLVAETKKPYEDLSRYSDVIAKNLKSVLENVDLDAEFKNNTAALVEVLLIPHHFYFIKNDNKEDAAQKMLESLGRAMDKLAPDMGADKQDLWHHCKDCVLDTAKRVAKGPEDDGVIRMNPHLSV